MTEQEKALWVQAKRDYTQALAIAEEAWTPHMSDPATLQAATATVLIHITKLRESSHRAAAQPSTAPTAVKRGSDVPASVGAVPPCPQCGGEMYDNREKKASGEFKPTSADFTCKDKTCKNEKGFRSGVWLPKANQKGANSKPKPTGGYETVPAALEDGDDDLPF